jgi:hypothetical protein
MTQKEKQGGFANTFQMFAAKAIVGALSPSKRASGSKNSPN